LTYSAQPSDSSPASGPSPGLDADEHLLASAASGNPHAFDLLVARWGRRVHSFLAQMLGEDGWSEDLTQDVFVTVHRELTRRDPQRSFSVWLFRIAHNAALDHLRRRRLQRRTLELFRAGLGPLARTITRRANRSPLAELEREELEAQLARAIGALGHEQRVVFLLREREELSYEEIAAVLGCNPKTVSSRLARARAQLRELLGPYLSTEQGRAGPDPIDQDHVQRPVQRHRPRHREREPRQ